MSGVDTSLAFIFPGQGSQSVGMLGALAGERAEVRETFDEASDALGFDLWDLVAHGPDDALNRTENTQPALLAASVSIWRVWRKSSNRMPAWMAGHSLGEYSALVCAGALDFREAVQVVRERGRAMQQAVPAGIGAMAAILGLDDELIVELCDGISRPDAIVSAANFNSPGQVVVAGHAAAVQRLIELVRTRGARRSVLLPVSVPSHCALMMPAAERLGSVLSSLPIASPATPVLHNVDAATHPLPRDVRDVLVSQLCSPVRWTASVQAMAASGVRRFVECGPGKVLSGLNKRIVPDGGIFAVNDLESLHKVGEALL